MRARIGADQTQRKQRDQRRGRRRRQQGRQCGKEKQGQRQPGEPWKVARSGHKGKQWLAGAKPGKPPPAAADELGAWGCYGVRQAHRGKSGGRREKLSRKTSGVQGDDGGRKASGVAHDSPGVGDKEGGIEASGVAENPRGYCQGGGGGVESPQGNGTPGVTDLPQGDKNPGVTTVGGIQPMDDRRGRGGDENPPTT